MADQTDALFAQLDGLLADRTAAKEVLEKFEAKRTEAAGELRKLDFLVSVLRSLAAEPDDPTADVMPADQSPPRRFGAATPGARVSVREAVIDTLQQQGRPMKCAELREPVERLRGVALKGKRPDAAIWAAIRSTDELLSRDGFVGLSSWSPDKWLAGVADEKTQ